MDEVKHLGVFFLNKIIIFTCYHRWLKKKTHTQMTEQQIQKLKIGVV
jgi:hypothetical protein